MADIYQQAYKVVAWLGLEDKSSDSVIDYLNSLGPKSRSLRHGLWAGPSTSLAEAGVTARSNLRSQPVKGKYKNTRWQNINGFLGCTAQSLLFYQWLVQSRQSATNCWHEATFYPAMVGADMDSPRSNICLDVNA
jgi:hypothetical protein